MYITDISDCINKIFPLCEGQTDWDNIGVLLDNGTYSSKILLTIDITDLVVEECIRKDIKNIISYHPVIFTGIKKINKDDVVRKLIRSDINVFSPHTSWDKEMNEYINGILDGRSPGEILQFLKNITGLKNLRVAGKIDSISRNIVVGVGAAFRYHNYKDSVIITGEMSHYCLLHSLRYNNIVILLEHSNSERIALPWMKERLEEVLVGCTIEISEEDKDPIEIL